MPRKDETPAPSPSNQTLVDPVCGMKVEPRQAAGPRIFQGENFYFCSEECRREFDSAPEAYAALDGRPSPPPA